MKDEKVKEMLKSRINILTKIKESKEPIFEQQLYSHEERVWRAKQYLDELEEAISVLESGVETFFLRRNLFEDRMAKADFAEIIFEGLFVTISIVGFYPNEPFWIIYLSPLREV